MRKTMSMNHDFMEDIGFIDISEWYLGGRIRMTFDCLVNYQGPTPLYLWGRDPEGDRMTYVLDTFTGTVWAKRERLCLSIPPFCFRDVTFEVLTAGAKKSGLYRRRLPPM